MHFRANMTRFLTIKVEKKKRQMRFPRGINKAILFESMCYCFWLRFGNPLGPMMATFFVPRRLKRLPRRHQDGPRRFKSVLDGPGQAKTPPYLPQNLDLDFGASRPEISRFSDTILIHFRMVLGSFLICKYLADYMMFE